MTTPHGAPTWPRETPARRASELLPTSSRDDAERVLLVDPIYKPGWDLPGGMAEANEAPRDAAARELREELGLSLPIGWLLVLDWVPAREPWDEQLVFIFDGGTLPIESVTTLRTVDPELAGLEFVELSDAAQRMRPDIADRLRRACAMLDTGGTDYRERGT